jgi:hypothetical protein
MTKSATPSPLTSLARKLAPPDEKARIWPAIPPKAAAPIQQKFCWPAEYLAHVERQGAIDLPYWRQVAPGLYEQVTTRRPRGTPARATRATRAELMERFGFSR